MLKRTTKPYWTNVLDCVIGIPQAVISAFREDAEVITDYIVIAAVTILITIAYPIFVVLALLGLEPADR